MGWLRDEFTHLGEALQHRGTWLFLAMLSVFAAISYLTVKYALRMDFLLRLHRLTSTSCRDLDNATMLTVFCASIFFGLALVVAFGEMARYSQLVRDRAHVEAHRAGWLCLGWGAVALLIGGTMLLVLGSQCY